MPLHVHWLLLFSRCASDPAMIERKKKEQTKLYISRVYGDRVFLSKTQKLIISNIYLAVELTDFFHNVAVC